MTPEQMREQEQLVHDLIALSHDVLDAQRRLAQPGALAECRERIVEMRLRIRALKKKHLGHE